MTQRLICGTDCTDCVSLILLVRVRSQY
eukprot:COSAG03_NODE_11203_length_606_cov_0.605523_1_plen_27_part_10